MRRFLTLDRMGRKMSAGVGLVLLSILLILAMDVVNPSIDSDDLTSGRYSIDAGNSTAVAGDRDSGLLPTPRGVDASFELPEPTLTQNGTVSPLEESDLSFVRAALSVVKVCTDFLFSDGHVLSIDVNSRNSSYLESRGVSVNELSAELTGMRDLGNRSSSALSSSPAYRFLVAEVRESVSRLIGSRSVNDFLDVAMSYYDSPIESELAEVLGDGLYASAAGLQDARGRFQGWLRKYFSNSIIVPDYAELVSYHSAYGKNYESINSIASRLGDDVVLVNSFYSRNSVQSGFRIAVANALASEGRALAVEPVTQLYLDLIRNPDARDNSPRYGSLLREVRHFLARMGATPRPEQVFSELIGHRSPGSLVWISTMTDYLRESDLDVVSSIGMLVDFKNLFPNERDWRSACNWTIALFRYLNEKSNSFPRGSDRVEYLVRTIEEIISSYDSSSDFWQRLVSLRTIGMLLNALRVVHGASVSESIHDRVLAIIAKREFASIPALFASEWAGAATLCILSLCNLDYATRLLGDLLDDLGSIGEDARHQSVSLIAIVLSDKVLERSNTVSQTEREVLAILTEKVIRMAPRNLLSGCWNSISELVIFLGDANAAASFLEMVEGLPLDRLAKPIDLQRIREIAPR